MTPIILASRSAARRSLLEAAGIAFTSEASTVDERAVEAPLLAGGFSSAQIAVALAEAKAADVSGRSGNAIVVGADQTLELDGHRWTKPENASDARQQLARLSGRRHSLHSGVAVAREGEVSWRHLDSAWLTMRTLSPSTIDAYLAEAGEAVLASVGGYQVEGPGLRLFEAVEGSYFTILGLPLLPLLAYLREEGAIPW